MYLTDNPKDVIKQIEDYSAYYLTTKDQKFCKAIMTDDLAEYESYLHNSLIHEC